ncbi:2-amino-4-hydroxy-6-hydroxymethyldihydropteridine diphosphokinase [Pseudomarimonas salicorniae]|uniref:2-amino-4-hydroxy-6-hydroxymethyldihydropteridine pyrophosphokinase n=1 Tax=Pseudomarimonas salicorniae TaxID=2933270 RepID=A0ABT0GGL2_9GAMM|nr:2-amino-4-hydroxy-6-hydroxymethyldihydropteridine diphosphokinase [Lysobacter sp. CAU 1642]MCK7593671.1 2-amino-4-hydroxy-6-hydroxymethyldihydropteridine diphosphokinase [Lysobacter sp. CAU 1642]
MASVLLSLGSNIDPDRHLDSAVAALRERFGELRISPYYRTPAVGFEGDDFLNAGALIETQMDPQALNAWLHRLEDAHGRRRDVPRFSARTLDIDIVLYDDLVLRGEGHLEIPRGELRHAFVLGPLADIAPDFVEPLSGQTLDQLWRAHPEHGQLRPEPRDALAAAGSNGL